MNATDKINKIKEAIDSGKTVFVNTMTSSVKITKRSWDAWDKHGKPQFKDVGGKLMMVERNGSYSNVGMCSFKVSK